MQNFARSSFFRPRQTWLWPIVVLAIVFGAFYFKPWQTKQAEIVSVSAEGKADTVADIAKITATITSENPNLDTARSLNEKKVSQIVSALQNLGIDAGNIKTQNISGNQSYIEPLIYPIPPRPNTNQFQTTIEITVGNFDKVDEVISTLTENGATNLYGPQLTLSDEKLETAKSQARQNAIDNAHKKATQLAQASERKVGKVVKISEGENFIYPQPLIAESQTDLKQKASLVLPGQNEVTVTISADYQLK